MVAILGEKIGMTKIFIDKGESISVTVIKAGPCYILNKKTKDINDYDAVQFGFGEIKEKNMSKPLKGYFNKINMKPVKYIRELRAVIIDDYSVGQEIRVDIFKEGDLVDVTGLSKGKGFAGVIKRWNFSGGGGGHGSMFHRAPGSMSASSYPSRVFKGKRLPGRLGHEKVTVKKIKVVRVDSENNLLILKGAVPGTKKGLLTVRKVS